MKFAPRILGVLALTAFLPNPTIVCQSISTSQLSLTIDDGKLPDSGYTARVKRLMVDGREVLSAGDGMYTSVKVGATTYSSMQLRTKPVKTETTDRLTLTGITYGDSALSIHEVWNFIKRGDAIQWTIERSFSKPVLADEAPAPTINFDSISTWEGAYQGYGGIAWFYLFNHANDTYGVHTTSSDFWNSKFKKGLRISVDVPGKKIAMSYTRTPDSRLSYAITSADQEMLPLDDSGTNRRRFVTTGLPVWSPFRIPAGATKVSITFSPFDFREKYGRGTLAGIDSDRVNAVLNTIARIGVIDSLHFGGNSWHTPYGPICLHEQYIAQLGLGINDPAYLRGYQSCLDFYRDHAILPDGRVYPRWAYTNEDAMPGRFNKDGFYEAQWGILMDSNPDYVSNVADLFDLTGDQDWVSRHRLSCEKALDWILRRDSNKNGLVEMMTDNRMQKQSSDWIDIIWASYENAFINAKLYHALVKWAIIEKLLDHPDKALHYEQFAARLKSSFNLSTKEGGFWDEENGCYIHWRDKDNTIHGRNMVTPVNFMAITYGICDDPVRQHRILDTIEAKMRRENLFFWPLTISSYAPDEGKERQFPFPSYENGDLFLSWGSIGIAAYANYAPDIALKYVKNVLTQYAKDGLAYQRYGRLKQDGLGDDILAGNSLSIVGLFQAIYGVNPLYNRFYLNPHITPELAGTALNYNYHGQRLTINLDSTAFAVSNDQFKVVSNKNFGFNATRNELSFFNSADSGACLRATSDVPVTISITEWGSKTKTWKQTTAKSYSKTVKYVVSELSPNTGYIISVDKRAIKKVRTDKNGNLNLEEPDSGSMELRITTDNHPFQKRDASDRICHNEIDFISDTQQPMVLEEVRLHPDHNIQATALLLSDILHQKPLGIYMLGDIVALGSSNRKWSTMDRFIDSCRKNNIAVHGLLGNHDLMWSRKKGEINFQHRFPDNVDIGYMSMIDSIAVVMLNSNFKKLSAIEINKQVRWYTSTLDSLNSDISVKTIIVCCHHAPYSNSRIVGSSAQVRRYLLPAFMQTPKCNLFIAGHAHAFEHFKYSGKNFLVIGGGGGLHQPLDTSARRLPDIAFNYKPRFHYLSVQRLGDTLLLTSHFLKSDFSGIERGYSFRLSVR